MSRFPFDWHIANRLAGTNRANSGYRGHIYYSPKLTPLATSATAVLAAATLGAAATNKVAADLVATINAKLAACPQLLEVKGNAVGIAGDVVITGLDICGNAITDTIALNASAAVPGVKAFSKVTNIHLPAKTNSSGDTVSVGVVKSVGVPFLSGDISAMVAGVYFFNGSTDAGSLSAHASDVSQSTYTPAGTPDGSKVLLYRFELVSWLA